MSDEKKDDPHRVARAVVSGALIEAEKRIKAARDADQVTRRSEQHDGECDTEDWECHASAALTGFADAARVVADLRAELVRDLSPS